MQKKRSIFLLSILAYASLLHAINIPELENIEQLTQTADKLVHRVTFSYTQRSTDQPGVVILKQNLPFRFDINSSNVVLNLNGKTITGGILVGENLRNVKITNGFVDSGSTFTVNAVHVQSGCEQIQISDLKIRNAGSGIRFDNTIDGLIENCELTQNVTAVVLNQSHNIVCDNVYARNNTCGGFCLLQSSTCCLRDCKALATGDGNTQVTDATIFGFASTDGYGNIFERCIANATQALSTTDQQSLVAGFALRGAEGCSKIVECESANAQTSVNGVTVPYGILLEGTIDPNLTLTASPQIPSLSNIEDVSWSPDMLYIAQGEFSTGNFYLYKFDTRKLVFTQTDSVTLSGNVRSVEFDPTGNYIGVIGYPGLLMLSIYRVNRETDTLELVVESSVTVNSVNGSLAWDPTGTYVAVAEQLGSRLLKIFKFDKVALTLTQIATADPLGSDLLTVGWSPDGRFVSVGSNTGTLAAQVFLFANEQLTFVDSATLVNPDGPRGMAWSPDGKYLAVGTAGIFYIFSVDESGSLTQVHTVNIGGNRFVAWSPDGKYIATAGDTTTNVRVLCFDRSTNSTTVVATSIDLSGITFAPNALVWSPDGQYISLEQFTFEALNYPSNNVIANNVVYCNSGGSQPRGIGISGSSIKNIIIGNISYSNPIDPFMTEENYTGVLNVFNQLFGTGPTALQNISVGDCEPICMPADVDLLLKQSRQKACDAVSRIDAFESIVDFLQSDPCSPTGISSGPITTEGSYCLTQDVAGALAINASNVILDLNHYKISGGISFSGRDGVTIKNGVVENSGSDGIAVSTSTNLVLENLLVKNSLIGANLQNVRGGTVKNCTFTQNITGLELDNSAKVSLDSCTARCNTNAGFCLLSSTTNCLRDCKALSTGEGNMNVLEQTVFGFVSADGYANIFERCIANSTQALSTTDSQSLIAGFALRGSEGCTKIIDSESANTQTNENGVTVPYGILLEGQLSELITVTSARPTTSGNPIIETVDWSPDGRYLAAGGVSMVPEELVIYEFDRIAGGLNRVVGYAFGPATGLVEFVRWSPCGTYLAVAGGFVDDDSFILKFDRTTQSLTLIATADPDFLTVEWSPDGRYLAAGGTITGDDLIIYQFNPVTESISQVVSISPGGGGSDTVRTVHWSPDGNYLVVGGTITDDDLIVYAFDRAAGSLTEIVSVDSGGTGADTIQSARWSCDGKYIAVGGNIAGAMSDDDFIIYQFDRSLIGTPAQSDSLIRIVSVNPKGTGLLEQVLAVDWSQDDRYVAIGGLINYPSVGDDLIVYQFDPGSAMLTEITSVDIGGSGATNDLRSLKWSPDGVYLAAGLNIDPSSAHDLVVYQAINFPSKNVIKNNLVYCNSGGSCPSGVGISGSSIQNLIIGNTAYCNPIPQDIEGGGPIVGSNYQFVTNVFNQNFGNAPSLTQNISLDCDEPINMPENVALLLKQSCAKVDDFGLCGPTAIRQGTTISQAGNYCLSQDLTADIAITTTCVFLDLNNRCLTGEIDVATAEHVLIANGNVTPSAGSTPAAITINSSVLNSRIENVNVVCADATAAGVGRDGITTAGHNIQIKDCTIQSGSAVGAGNDGGDGILIEADSQSVLIKNCTIRTGNGGDSSSATAGGGGGHGLAVEAGAVNGEILDCVVMETGVGGDNSSTGDGGPGGNGVNIEAGAVDIAVTNCVFRNTGAGGVASGAGADGVDGRAVNDDVTTAADLSQVFSNFAHNIASATKFDLQATGVESGLLTPNPPTGTIINPFANIYN